MSKDDVKDAVHQNSNDAWDLLRDKSPVANEYKICIYDDVEDAVDQEDAYQNATFHHDTPKVSVESVESIESVLCALLTIVLLVIMVILFKRGW